jgi:protein-S-isoprenylcysteine O-methyltransferase Ste14
LVCAIIESTFLRAKINIIVAITGIVLIFLGVLLKIWVLRTLGRYWSVHIEIREGHKLITDGPYKFIRHPSFLSTAIKGIAFMLLLNAYISIALFFVICFPLLLKRIHLEEEELTKLFGVEYLDYRNSVSTFFPIKYYKPEKEEM